MLGKSYFSEIIIMDYHHHLSYFITGLQKKVVGMEWCVHRISFYLTMSFADGIGLIHVLNYCSTVISFL
jgi:hypothetical protein